MKLPKAYATIVRKLDIDLTLSVNPLGCSPRAMQILKKVRMRDVSIYPDSTALVRKLSRTFGIPASGILLGNGSEQLIKLVSQTFVRQKDRVFVEAGSFFLFSKESLLAGGSVEYIDLLNVRRSVPRPKVLFIANPTTPGGINRTNKELVSVIRTLRPAIAVVDEANGEFRNETMIEEIRDVPNLIVLRTFSKALGLAGLRIGVCFGNTKTIAQLNERLQPFPVSSVALKLAEVSLTDTAFLERTKKFVASERQLLTRALTTRGFAVSQSVTNNLFVSGPQNSSVIRKLAKRGVSVIDGAFFPGNRTPGFRISLKDRKTNRRFLAVLDEVLACLPNNNLLRSKEVL